MDPYASAERSTMQVRLVLAGSLHWNQGEHEAVIGPAGSGKTPFGVGGRETGRVDRACGLTGRRRPSRRSGGDLSHGAVYDTGRGGDSIDWSADVPPAPVPCHIQAAGLVQVTSTTDTTCPSGAGKASWTYTSDVSGETSKLCVTRIYHKYYCVLGKQVGDKTLLGSMTAVDCKAQRIPAAYNRIIHITGVYQASPNASTRNCAQGPNDQTRYLAWLVDDDKLLLCAQIFQGG
ncbi:hypothetical protein [Streptomyces sp. NPDC056244]|uniref:hypothetical protein n=1 Tax=Streptomyces sp. NPDC056244 TaxID=3345762 RepID=UPI0035DF9591